MQSLLLETSFRQTQSLFHQIDSFSNFYTCNLAQTLPERFKVLFMRILMLIFLYELLFSPEYPLEFIV
jgi:hypothetical protein